MDYSYRSPLEDSYYDNNLPPLFPHRYSPYPESPARTFLRRGGHSSHAGYQHYDAFPHEGGYRKEEDIGRPNGPFQFAVPGNSLASSRQPMPMYSQRYKPPSYPRALTDLFEAQECKLCGVELLSPIVAKMHYSGKQHMKKVKSYMIDWCEKTGNAMPNIGDSIHTLESVKSLADYCEICNVRLISINDKLLHYSGKNHRKNELDPANAKKKKKAYEAMDISDQRFGIGSGFVPEDKLKQIVNTDNFVCELCDVKAVSKDQLEAHLSGKKHKEKVAKKDSLPKPVNPNMSILASVVKEQLRDRVDYSMHRTPTEKRFLCKVCDISLETYNLYQLHIAGKRHSKNLLKKEMEGLDFCDVCELNFTSYDQYQMHMVGKKHEKRCQSKYKSTINDVSGGKEKISLACKLCPFVGSLDKHKCDKSLLNIEYENLEKKWICFPCHNMMFDSEQELKEHKNTRRHMMCVLNQEDGDKIVEEIRHWYCFICKKQYQGNKEYTEHLFQQRHMALSDESANLESKVDLFQCSVCDIVMDKEAKESHMQHPKHLKAALTKDTMASLTKLANENISTLNFHCSNCDVMLPNFVLYSQHLLGEDHMNVMIRERIAKG